MNSSKARGRSERSSSSSGVRYGVWMRSAWVIGDYGRRCSSKVSCGSGGAQCIGDQLLGTIAVQVAQQFVGLQRVVAKCDQPLVCERARTVIYTTHDSDTLECALYSHLLAQLNDDALGRALAYAWHRLKACGVGARDR